MNLNHPLPIELVQILPFPNFDNLQPLMAEEIQYDDLLGFLNDPVTGPAQIHQDNINIGFAQILQLDAGPVFSSWVYSDPSYKPSPEANGPETLLSKCSDGASGGAGGGL